MAKNFLVVCEHCNEPFSTRREGRRFCSKTCANRHSQPITAKVERVCENCQKTFLVWQSKPGRYCSASCRNSAGGKHKAGVLTKPESTVWLTCEVCQSPYKVHKVFTTLRKSRFCSRKCQAIDAARRMASDRNPNYRDGKASLYRRRGPNWPEKRREIRKRDNNKCRVCGSTGPRLAVHHIIPYRKFKGDWQVANQNNNLILLCQTCHRQAEAGIIACPIP